MSSIWRRAAPYAVGVGGIVVITAAIALVRPLLDLPNLSAAYLIFVLFLGWRFGWIPAVVAALVAFGLYDWFLVQPVGTLWISAPRELLNLLLLIAAALAGGRLAASMAAQRRRAVDQAAEAGILYELAVAALRDGEGSEGLTLLCRRAATACGLPLVALVEFGDGGAAQVAGDGLTGDEIDRARFAHEHQVDLGARVKDGRLELIRTYPRHSGPAFVRIGQGVAVLGLPADPPAPAQARLLAAMLGLAGLLLDRRRAEAVGAHARSLEASDRLKTAVLSSISHELKSPIASLRAGLTTLLMPRSGLGPEQAAIAAGLDREAGRLDHLVGDLLTMSRLEAGVAPERAPHHYDELVGTALHALRRRLAPFDVVLAIGAGLPPVSVDELLIERVLTNLLENAADWTPAGGRIEVGARGRDGLIEAWVENEGEGVPPADLPVLFDKFWTRRGGGSGLGLAICRQIVEAHGGSIRAENTRRGPRFTFTLEPAQNPLPAATV